MEYLCEVADGKKAVAPTICGNNVHELCRVDEDLPISEMYLRCIQGICR